MKKHFIAPSILSSDFGRLKETIEMLNESDADWIHLDIMDGRFVPNISFGIPVVAAIKKYAKKFLDVHLMIVEPEKYINAFADAGADLISLHYEASPHLHRSVHAIKERGVKAGVAVNPHTSVVLLTDILKDVDLVNLMTVNPGFGGQKFIQQSIQKIRQLKILIESAGSPALIEIDGGVKTSNAKEILQAGADVLVAGSDVFSGDDPASVIKELKSIDRNTISV